MQQSLGRTAIWAVAVVSVALIMATGDVEAPPAAKVTEVTGTVDVGNFPSPQGVTGTVDVGNLPLDADGNLRTSPSSNAPPERIRFIGYTNTEYTNFAPISPAHQECNADFPNSRVCRRSELLLSIPVAPIDPERPCVLTMWQAVPPVIASQLQVFDLVISQENQCPSTGMEPYPVACCGF